MTKPRILHLVDDRTAGGVMRYLDYICTCPRMAETATHTVADFVSGRLAGDADVIVSHLSVNWRRLPALMRLRAEQPGMPIVHVEHSYTGAFADENVRRPRRFRALLATAYSLFDRVVAVSHCQADWLQTEGVTAPAKLSVISPTVDLGPFLDLAPVTGPIRVLGALGRLERQKGFDTLISALRQSNAKVELRIFGEGSERAALEALADGDPRVRFMGQGDPASAMDQVDAVVMPSRWEAYGLVALEARAAGRPLLVAEVDGLRDHVSCGARAVAGGSVDGWEEALETLGHAEASPATRAEAAGSGPRLRADWQRLIQDLLHEEEPAFAA